LKQEIVQEEGYIPSDSSFSSLIELGAEFVHGNLPLTSRLLKDAGITYEPVAGEIYHFEYGVLQKDAGPNKYWKEFKQKLSTIEKDVSLREFLDKSFADRRYAGLVRSVESFASGFDTADISQASAVALRNEWFGDEENAINYHISKGYSAMLKHLERQVEAGGGKLYLSKTVQQITWEKGKVNVLTTDREEFTAPKVIITVPLGVLQAKEGEG
jgi:monoamine oxidase